MCVCVCVCVRRVSSANYLPLWFCTDALGLVPLQTVAAVVIISDSVDKQHDDDPRLLSDVT